MATLLHFKLLVSLMTWLEHHFIQSTITHVQRAYVYIYTSAANDWIRSVVQPSIFRMLPGITGRLPKGLPQGAALTKP